ncbi:MAG: succinylglutamate desuccinylase/aspartoacylase family protein [Balneolaceae bacterium]|nr:succinylglutamate desuccinylase/aspartoacylase family protein [Balneolaceae bacterium]
MIQDTKRQTKDADLTRRAHHSNAELSDGPVVVLFVGIHGNETAGVIAAERVLKELSAADGSVNGSLYVIEGNSEALARGVRYVDRDLNRLWEMYNTENDFSAFVDQEVPAPVEYLESLRIKASIEEILEKHDGDQQEFIFADLHTTSSESCAFILLNDTLSNRALARKFPVPQILGIEENIHGTLLSYINNLGFRSIGFEAGAHTSEKSVTRSEAFIRLLLHNCGLLRLELPALKKAESEIRAYSEIPETYFEIRYHYLVDDAEQFRMLPGFRNFHMIEKGTPLAYDKGKLGRAPESGRIFMPLYQKKGDDGFLIIREVSPFWLTLSAWMRESFFHSLLRFLPGVDKKDEQTFEVDREVAQYLVKEIFHLLGYRVTEKDRWTYVCYRR